MPKDVVSRDFTINLHKRLFNIGAKKRAPRAIKEIRKFAAMNMATAEKDVRIDATVNKAVWSTGIAVVPSRMRIRVSRLRQTGEGKERKFYTVVSHVAVPRKELRHMKTVTVEEQAE
jgi:large subunit ribosomal protein L31e